MDNVWVIYVDDVDYVDCFNDAVYTTKEKAIAAVEKTYNYWNNQDGYWTDFDKWLEEENSVRFDFVCHDSIMQNGTRVAVWVQRLPIE